jgi:predicted transcriptional regulator
MNFSESIKQVLKSRGLNPSDLARMTGYTPQYMYDLLAGDRRWNETTMKKTCDALGLEIRIIESKNKLSTV